MTSSPNWKQFYLLFSLQYDLKNTIIIYIFTEKDPKKLSCELSWLGTSQKNHYFSVTIFFKTSILLIMVLQKYLRLECMLLYKNKVRGVKLVVS